MSNSNPSLIIKIEYKNYISLSDFKESIEGWNNQYNSFISQGNDDKKNDTLLIKEIKQGSIIIELVSTLVPLISDVNTVYSFFTSMKDLFGWLHLRKGIKPKINTDDLDNTKKIVAPVSNRDGRQITVSIEGDNNAPIIIDSMIAKAIVQNANDEYAVLNTPVDLPETQENKEDVIFKLTQIKDDENPNKNTKGIAQTIDSREHLVLFSHVKTKEAILRGSSNPFRKTYLVDIKINKIDRTIKSYTILALKDSYTDEDGEVDLFSDPL
ncbi:hypothetical protein Holit_02092 [Hollandina sp. SP2]